MVEALQINTTLLEISGNYSATASQSLERKSAASRMSDCIARTATEPCAEPDKGGSDDAFRAVMKHMAFVQRPAKVQRSLTPSHNHCQWCSAWGADGQKYAILSASLQKKTKLDRTMRC